MTHPIPEIHDATEPIAIIGAACRLAGEVSDLGTLWDMISREKTGHCKVPSDRWDADVWHHPDPDRRGAMAVKHGYFLKSDVAHFDAPFFSTTAKEAAAMDPMKRMLLEVSYESIENAGIPVDSLLNTPTGCYVGCMTNDYEMLSLQDIHTIGHNAASATSEAMTSNRISWFYGLKGPSFTLDTACSSSLYALHLACQSLRLGETNLSLVAGVNLILVPNTTHQLSAMHMLSPEGISHTFDDRANGYGRGEGIGCIVVKRLKDALRDGDTIRAVIRGSGANADGKTPSITQPSADAQAELIRSVYAQAGLGLEGTQYFECHGTGTPVGDPIELTALANTFGAARKSASLGPLYIGSIKPSVGHTEGCSGLAGIFKSLLLLERGQLVPTYGVERINPKLKLSEWNLALPATTQPWPTKGLRRISVNSFGFGGANAHVILDDAAHYMMERGIQGRHTTVLDDDEIDITTTTTVEEKKKKLFVFSTKDQAGIPRLSTAYSTALASKSEESLTDLAYTLSVRRSPLDFRSFAIADSIPSLTSILAKGLPKLKRSSRQDVNIAFVFTGQGAQWAGMGIELLGNKVFRESVAKSQKVLKQLGCKWDAVEELSKGAVESNIALPEYSQTLCTVLQVAVVDLLRAWGIVPKATVGHSSGEIAAAYAANYISHPTAIKIAYVRGLSSSTVTRKGAMMAAGLSPSKAREYLSQVPANSAVIACINSPSSVTLSGDVSSIDALETIISGDGRFARKLKVKTAYHSPHMRDVADGYLAKIGTVEPVNEEDTTAVMYSSLTGQRVKPSDLTAQYWVDNMCSPVEFSNAVGTLLTHTAPGKKVAVKWDGFVEIGPHAALQGPVQQIIAASSSKNAKDAPYLGAVLRGKDANETALTVAGTLWALGYEVDLAAVNGFDDQSSGALPKALTDLPTYPWNHGKRFWHESYVTKSNRFPAHSRTDLLGVPEDLQNPLEPRWRNHLRISENPWIEDHQITGTILYPGAGMLIMALEGALKTADPTRKVHGFRYKDITFERGLVVPSGDDSPVETRLNLLPHESIPGQFHYTIYSTTTGTGWTKHCAGTIALEYAPTSASEVEDTAADSWADNVSMYKQLTSDASGEDLDVDDFYDNLDTIGMQYGPLFRNVISLTAVPAQTSAHAAIVIPDTKSSMPKEYEFPHVMHPATMDAIFHLLLAAFNDGRPIDQAAVPYAIEEMFVAADQPHGAGKVFHGYGTLVAKKEGGRELIGDLVVSDEEFTAPKLTVKGFALRQVTADDGAAGTGGVEAVKKCARVEWMEDIDFLGAEQAAKFSLEQWLDRLTHKKAVGDVLVVLADESTKTDVLVDMAARVGTRPGFAKIVGTATTEEGLEILRSVLPPSETAFEIWGDGAAAAKGSYDAVVLIGQVELPKLHKILSPQGHLIQLGSSSVDSLTASGFRKILPLSSNITIASSSLPPIADLPTAVTLLLPTPSSSSVTTLASNLTTLLKSSNITVTSTSLTSGTDFTGKHIISLLESSDPLIYSWDEAAFTAFKSLVSTATHTLWLTHGSLLESWSAGVEFAPAQGLLRVLRNEYPLTTLPHLDLSKALSITSPSSAELIHNVWKTSLVELAEMEYAELDGKIYVPRAVGDDGFDEELQLANNTAKPVRSHLRGGKPLVLAEAVQGGEFLWLLDADISAPLAATEVEIEVEFFGLNANDTPGLGREAVGVVAARGEKVKSVAIGQRVVVFGSSRYKTNVRVDESRVAAIPSGVRDEDAAALPTVFVAAQYALFHIANLSRGQTVLLHSGANALSQAALQVAQFVGADVFALVSTKEEKEILTKKYNLPTSRIFDSSLQSFIPAITKATNGKGADVIFTPSPSQAIYPSLSLLADFGHFLDLNTIPMSLPQLKTTNASITKINIDRVIASHPELATSLFHRTFDFLVRSGGIGAITPTTVFSASDLPKALETVKTQAAGKVVVKLDRDATVLTLPPPPPRLVLDAQGTYVLAGGLGALGLKIAGMMAEHGAGHLVFLSRSGGGRNEEDLARFRAMGVEADAFKCDVNNSENVKAVFDTLKQQGRIVKGVVQCAMVLEDTIFDNMTHAKWTRAIHPKTHGSKNLLSHLSPEHSPFFILLSSITGIIGNTAQANYASGNTFEDALSHYARAHLSIPATSIDVGLVSDSSHFTSAGEFGDLESYLHKYQHGWVGLQTSVEELNVALKAIMRGSTANGGKIPGQLVLGLGDVLVREEGSTGFANDRKFNLRVKAPEIVEGADGEVKVSVGDQLAMAESLADATTVVENSLKVQIAAAVGVAVDEVDVQKPLFDFGVDSLKAVEIRNKSLRELKSDISVFELLSATPLAEIAAKIAARSALVKVAKAE